MKIMKPMTLGMLYKPFSMYGKNQLCVMAMGFFKLTQAKTRFLIGPKAFAAITPQLPLGQPLDMVMPKGESEFIVCGHAYAPNGKPLVQMDVNAELGSICKKVRVYGDRQWYYGNLSKFQVSPPQPFTKMSLGYQHAFGGSDYPFNRIGRGYNPNITSFLYGQRNASMPNLEYPCQPVQGHKKAYLPAAFGPMDIMWEQRSKYMGTYDQQWMKSRFPGLPDNADMRLYNMASEDQRQKQAWQGGEAYRLHGMHPEHQDICGNLPNFRIRGLLKIDSNRDEKNEVNPNNDQGIEYRFLNFKSDTVWFFPDSDIGVILYRCITPIEHPDGLDAKAVMLAYENPSDPRKSEEHYIDQIKSRLDINKAAAHALNDAALIPRQPEYVRLAREKANQARKTKQDEKTLKIIEQLEKDMDLPSSEESQLSDGDDFGNDGLGKFEIPEELSTPMTMDEIADGGVDLTNALAHLEAQKKAMKSQLDTGLNNTQKQMDELSFNESEEKTNLDENIDDSWSKILDRANYLPIDLHPEEGRHSDDVEQLIELLKSDSLDSDSIENSQEPEVKSTNKETDYSQFEKMQRQAKRVQTQLDKDLKTLSKPLAIKLGYWLSQAVLEHLPMAGRDLANVSAKGINLSGLDLREVNFGGANLVNANFENANLQGANFLGAILNNANFSNTNLCEANFSRSQSRNCHFNKANLTSALFVGANLKKSYFRQADLSKAIFTEAMLDYADLTQATLIQTLMSKISANNSVWISTNISQTILPKAQLNKADFSKSTINRSVFSDVEGFESVWSESNAIRSFFGSANLQKSFWVNAEIKTCGFRLTNLDSSDAREATFYQSDFGGASIKEANWNKSVLCRSLFSETHLVKSTLIGADLNQAICRGTNFTDTDLSKAILVNADMSHSRLVNTELKDVLESTV